MLYNKVFYENREIKNERVELTDKGSLYFLGANVTFKNCTLVLKVSGRNLLFDDGTRFIDCTFEMKQELKNHQQWVFAFLKRCRFKGRLSGCDFGHWPGYTERARNGAIEDCDFTEARMDGCRIMGSDPGTLRLPGWPCFTILDPIGRSGELNSAQWPGQVGPIVIETLRKQPPGTTALIEDAVAIAKRFATTPEELRTVIEKFDCIRC